MNQGMSLRRRLVKKRLWSLVVEFSSSKAVKIIIKEDYKKTDAFNHQ